MNDIITIQNVRAYPDANNTAWLNAEDVARGLGFTQIAASGNSVVRWERVNRYLREFCFIPTSGDGVKAGDYISENMLYRLAMKVPTGGFSNEQEQRLDYFQKRGVRLRPCSRN